ncbi:MAG: response regulator [Pseudomonadota bacterium]
MSKPAVLIVEDEIASLNLLASYFENDGYQTYKATDSDSASSILQENNIDVALLDINLPGKDGLTLLREIRSQSDIGIILVTSKRDDIDRIVGLELGADDYVTKPYNPRELMVRVKNLVQRIRSTGSGSAKKRLSEHKHLQFAEWQLNTGRRLLTSSENEQCQLTEGEYKLLTALIDHAGEVLSRDNLMNQIGGRDWFPNDRTIDVLIARLRKKLGDTRDEARIINTAHGTGYIFVAEVQHE